VAEKPGDQVAIKRLMDLYRERDGQLTALASELESTIRAGGSAAYGAGLALAEVAQSQGDLPRAERTLADAIVAEPRRPEGYLARARLESARGDLARARASLEQALPLQNGVPREETLGQLWQLCLELSDLPCAQHYHGTLVRAARGNGFVAGELGRALLARGRHREAIDELRRVARAAEGDRRALVPALRDLGRAELVSGDSEAALRTLERASRLSEGEPALRAELDALRAEAHRALGTQASYLKELASSARTAEQFALLASLYEELGQLDQAAHAYRRASELAPRDIDLRLSLVRVLELTLDLAGAEKELAKLVRQAPGQIDLVLRHIDLLLAAGERERALAELDRAALRFESDASASFLLLELAERLGEAERARRIELVLATKSGLDRRHLVELGSRAYRQGDGDKARSLWKRLLSDRDKTRGAVLYGETLLGHDDVKGGLDVLEQAVAAAPSEIEPKVALARGLLRAAALATGPAKKDYERRALAAWLIVLKDPKADRGADQTTRAEARRQVVRLLKRTGRLTVDMAALERAFQAPTPSTEAGLTLAEAQILLRNSSDAERTLTRLHELMPGDRNVLHRLERVQLDQGKRLAAVGTLERLLAIDPGHAREILGRLADLAFELHDDDRAIAYAERGVSLNPTDAEALAKLGTLYERSGRLADAEGAYRKALAQDVQMHAVAIHLARLLGKRGEHQEALALLLRSLRSARHADDLTLLGKQAMSAAASSDLMRELEDQLRPLCISRPETPALRTLLLEVVSRQRVLLEDRAERADPAAARALAELADRNLGPLLSVLASADLEEQEQVILLLAWGTVAASSAALLEFAEGPAPEPQRVAAIEAATKHDSPAVASRLLEVLRKRSPNPRGALALAVVRGLARISGAEARRGLLLALEAEDPSIRAEALWALGQRKPPLPEADLVALLRSENEGEATRTAAALALGQRARSRAAALALTAELGRDSALLQAGVLAALATQAPQDRRFLEAASAALFGADARLAAASVGALATVDASPPATASEPGKTQLDWAIERDTPRIEELLWRELARATPAAQRMRVLEAHQTDLVAALEVALQTSRASATQALRAMARSSGRASLAPLFVADELGSREASDLELRAERSAASIHLAVLPWLVPHAEGSDRELSTLALGTLCPEQGSLSRTTLTRALQGSDDAKFEAAAFALAECNSDSALPLLKDLVKSDPAWPRLRRVAAVLEDMGRRQTGALDASIAALLRQLASSENELVKTRAHAALAALGLTGENPE